jgi:hypothetical protein
MSLRSLNCCDTAQAVGISFKSGASVVFGHVQLSAAGVGRSDHCEMPELLATDGDTFVELLCK